jgi:hypothetical protein
VLFEDVQSAQKCIKLFDESREFGLNQKPIKVDFWQSKVDLTNEREEKNYASLTQLVSIVMKESSKNFGNQGNYR